MKESSESQGHMWNDGVKDRLNSSVIIFLLAGFVPRV